MMTSAMKVTAARRVVKSVRATSDDVAALSRCRLLEINFGFFAGGRAAPGLIDQMLKNLADLEFALGTTVAASTPEGQP